MSQENVETIGRALEAWNSGGVDALLAFRDGKIGRVRFFPSSDEAVEASRQPL